MSQELQKADVIVDCRKSKAVALFFTLFVCIFFVPPNDTLAGTVKAALPSGYFVQGGLIWSPNTLYLRGNVNYGRDDWASANNYCNNTVINGQSGWRLPTENELTLFARSMIRSEVTLVGWNLSRTWTSTPFLGRDLRRSYNGHVTVDMMYGHTTMEMDTIPSFVTCVHENNGF